MIANAQVIRTLLIGEEPVAQRARRAPRAPQAHGVDRASPVESNHAGPHRAETQVFFWICF